jgi:hypothetical protein
VLFEVNNDVVYRFFEESIAIATLPLSSLSKADRDISLV